MREKHTQVLKDKQILTKIALQKSDICVTTSEEYFKSYANNPLARTEIYDRHTKTQGASSTAPLPGY